MFFFFYLRSFKAPCGLGYVSAVTVLCIDYRRRTGLGGRSGLSVLCQPIRANTVYGAEKRILDIHLAVLSQQRSKGQLLCWPRPSVWYPLLWGFSVFFICPTTLPTPLLWQHFHLISTWLWSEAGDVLTWDQQHVLSLFSCSLMEHLCLGSEHLQLWVLWRVHACSNIHPELVFSCSWCSRTRFSPQKAIFPLSDADIWNCVIMI